MIPYKNENYANQRLVKTIVRYEQKAVIVEGIVNGMALISYLSNGKKDNVRYETLDLDPVPLGFINSGGSVSYACRRPMRRDWRQGLRKDNLLVFHPDWDGVLNANDLVNLADPDHIERFDGLIFERAMPNYKDLARTIENKYTLFDDVRKNISNQNIFSGAYHRYFALTSKNLILHKGKYSIGKIDSLYPFKYTLFDEYLWAREAFEWSLQ